MAKPGTIRITFIRAAIPAISAVVALLTSVSCKASCGEYVYSRYRTATLQMPDVGTTDDDVLKSDPGVSTIVIGVGYETHPAIPIPCEGPDCRRNPTPSQPVAPQSTIGSSHQDRLISGQPDVELPSEVSHRRDIKDHARTLRGFPLLIEMPPEFVG